MIFPISMPSAPVAKSIRWRRKSIVGVAASPFSGQQQIYAHAGRWWEADVTLPPMTAAQAKDWLAFVVNLNGMEGTFTWTPPDTGWTGSGVTKPTGPWRMLVNELVFDVAEGMIYGFSFACREAF